MWYQDLHNIYLTFLVPFLVVTIPTLIPSSVVAVMARSLNWHCSTLMSQLEWIFFPLNHFCLNVKSYLSGEYSLVLPVNVLVSDDEQSEASLLVESSLVLQCIRLVLGFLYIGGHCLNINMSQMSQMSPTGCSPGRTVTPWPWVEPSWSLQPPCQPRPHWCWVRRLGEMSRPRWSQCSCYTRQHSITDSLMCDVPSLARHQSPLGVYFVQPVIVNRGDVLIWQAEYQQTLTVQGTDQTMDSPPAECGDIGGKVLLEVDKRNLGGMLDLGGNDLNNVDMSFGGKSWKIWEFSDGFVQTKITWKIDNLQTFVILTWVVSSCVQENLNASSRRQIISPKSANITSPLIVHGQFKTAKIKEIYIIHEQYFRWLIGSDRWN